ncbi:MAG: RsiV family protein, partial [Synergistaceae bacterium]|nr:RsiV family protein [Synergistaceae bacterium]
KNGSDYVGVISNYIRREMEQRNAKSKGTYWVKEGDISQFKEIKPNQNFYLSNKGNIVICFDKYEVAAGAQGSPEFEIPPSVIKHIMK